MDKFILLCANLIRGNCSDEICDLIKFARDFERQASWNKSELSEKNVEISRLKAENEFLRRTLEESENTD